jgi:hypothetical protein
MAIFTRSLSNSDGAAIVANQNPDVDVSEPANDHPFASEGRLVLDQANSVAAASALRTRRADLEPTDRDTFDRWARRVTAFYSLLAISLLGAMLLVAHAPERKNLFASHANGRVAPDLPVPVTLSIVK